MNIRQAILEAASLIEKNPELYAWHNTVVPACGSPGCMLGWIGSFLGDEPGLSVGEVARKHLGVSRSSEMYCRLPDPCGTAPEAVKFLRKYADKYHPAEPLIERKSGAEICRDIIARPFKETADV